MPTSNDNAERMHELLSCNSDRSPNHHCILKLSPKEETDPAALTQEKLMQLFNKFFSAEANLAIVYFCGHGQETVSGGCMVTQNNTTANPGVPFAYLLSLAEDALRDGRIHEVILIIDCCYSGDIGNISLFGKKRAYIPKGLSILTSSASNELSYYTKDSTIFTHHLIDGLEGGAADLLGEITVISLYSYVNKMLSTLQHQTPYLKTYSSSLNPIRKNNPRISIDNLRRIVELFPNKEKHQLNPKYEDSIPGFDPVLVELFKIMQEFNRQGLVKPDGEDHMYYAAINNKSCSLTDEGEFYWELVDRGRI